MTSSPMSACSTAAAATALRRARNIGYVSGGGKEGEGRAKSLHSNQIFLARHDHIRLTFLTFQLFEVYRSKLQQY
jgi:hypothetical protein